MASVNRCLLRNLGIFFKVKNARTAISASRHFSSATKLCHRNFVYGAVCVQRVPVITALKNDVENRYSDLLSKIELENSYYSDFELRLKKESQTAKKLKEESSEDSEETVDSHSETGLDLQDKWDKEFKEFVAASRETDADRANNQKSLERKLDSPLYLLLKQNIEGRDHWVLPQALWQQGETLRQTAERALSLCGEVRATFLGNAPCAVAKFEPKVKEGDTKVKAWYKEGEVIPNKPEASDYLWVTRNELEKFCHKSYEKHLQKFLFDL